MSKLYIGNATRQTHQFAYRMPGVTKVITINIPKGRQIQIPGDLQPEEIEHIVSQHARYGMVSADEISRTKAFHGLCFSSKPIPSSKLNYLHEHNIGVLDGKGREFRKLAAIASNQKIEQALRENGRPEQLQEYSLFIQEDRQDNNSRTPQVSEELKVINNPNPPAHRPRRRAA